MGELRQEQDWFPWPLGQSLEAGSMREPGPFGARAGSERRCVPTCCSSPSALYALLHTQAPTALEIESQEGV